MISVEDAIKLLSTNLLSLVKETMPLDLATNKIIAEDIYSPVNHPLFDQTAVDGYCFKFKSLENNCRELRLSAEIKAGETENFQLSNGECARIFTGAPICSGADTIIMQENVSLNKQIVRINKTDIKIGANLRKAGEQIKKGDIALQKGTKLNPAAIGFLASLGIKKVIVSKSPRIQIILSGDEFIESEMKQEKGKIFESNGIMLAASLNQLGIDCKFKVCPDDLHKLTNMIKEAEDRADILLLSGGVSVGKYDFTKSALEGNNFITIFHKVKQKPGKPLLFSRKKRIVAFGLPGNPRAVLICFYIYILPYIRNSMGEIEGKLIPIRISLSSDYKRKDDGKVHFLAGHLADNKASILGAQGSHMLNSLSQANILIKLTEKEISLKKGDLINAYVIP